MKRSAASNDYKKGQLKILRYVITQSYAKRTFDPKDSDYSANAVHMRQLLGTLLKFNSVNTFVPRLAESWKTDQSGKHWSFKLRQHLTCEDGTQINAATYKRGLELAFRNHAPSKSTPAFSHLVGWEDFISGKTKAISGITADETHHLKMEFDAFPSGLEAYLSMPYFGFYCPSNFDEDGNWKSPNQIASSGPYKLKFISDDNSEIILSRRENWPIDRSDSSADEISIKVLNEKEALASPPIHTIIEIPPSHVGQVPNGWKLFRGALTISSNLILNMKRSTFLDSKLRKSFAALIRKKLKDPQNKLQAAMPSPDFYPFTAKSEKTLTANTVPAAVEKIPSAKIYIEDAPLDNERAVLIRKIIVEALEEFNLHGEFVSLYKNAYSVNQYDSERDSQLDLYVTSVDKGGAAEPWVVRMMFCSELGVKFPDPSGKICNLVKKFENRTLSPEEYEDFGTQFESAIRADSALVPLIHRGQNYFFSNDIDISQLSPNMGITDLEKINLQ